MAARALLVANPKGGSGKTTLAVNLAGWLASQNRPVALLDLDPQKSATTWLATRDMALPDIDLVHEGGKTDADWLVIDSPAGLAGKSLERALKLVHKVVVPVAPSLFDIRASQAFLDALRQEKAVRKGRAYVGVVGMRVDPRTRAGATLEQFLENQDLPLITHLRYTQHYVNAAFEGKSLFDLPAHLVGRDLEQWAPLARWIDL